MEDRASQRVDLIATIFAFVALTATDTVVAGVDDATVGAGRHVSIGLFKHILQAGDIVWEPFVELFDGECLTHTSIV